MTTTSPAPATLPAVTCAPWCLDGNGHADVPFPEDQVCRGDTVEIELTHRPLVQVDEETWTRETVRLYLLRHPGALRTSVEMYRGELGETVSLTVDEAEALGRALLDAVQQTGAGLGA
ncbi:hypothetical protein [Nocardioides sp.]|uniref:DUF6907 domain-containing protein n=1 Tax=Nocardioides sp. TaxID=35761 RepID=UPI0026046244|nr:hypothetical protein [Nocardioides sp.]MCW2737905.1 hypothetical protein [Nocardioides sp.]